MPIGSEALHFVSTATNGGTVAGGLTINSGDTAWMLVSTVLVLLMLLRLRGDEEAEREGLDLSDHGERAYN